MLDITIVLRTQLGERGEGGSWILLVTSGGKAGFEEGFNMISKRGFEGIRRGGFDSRTKTELQPLIWCSEGFSSKVVVLLRNVCFTDTLASLFKLLRDLKICRII